MDLGILRYWIGRSVGRKANGEIDAARNAQSSSDPYANDMQIDHVIHESITIEPLKEDQAPSGY